MTLPMAVAATSNVAPRPNVAPRNAALHFTEDMRFLRNIRGRSAVLQLVRALGYSTSIRAFDPAARALRHRGVLTDAHLFYLEEDVPCVSCERNPVGMDFRGRRAFRCDRPDCRR